MQRELFTGQQLKQEGMQRATENADRTHEGWSEKALSLLKEFVCKTDGGFMGEDVREYATAKGLDVPPSKRAWGNVMVTAKAKGIIRSVSIGPVKNPKAHNANATVWRRV